MSNNESTLWRPIPLVVCNVLALLLILSWYSDWGQALWAPLDKAVFFALNGSLAEGHAWQMFWAVTNTRRFDYTSALVVLLLFSYHILSGNRRQIIERTAAAVLTVFTVVIAVQVSRNFLDYGRPGPSTSLEPAILLSQIITGFEFKDTSNNSFPGGHGITLIMFTSMLWYFAGRGYGLVMLFLSLFLLLPSMVTGAHWLTDTLVGASYVSLVALSWVLATPLHQRIIGWIIPLVEKSVSLGERLLLFVSGNREKAERDLAQAPLNAGKGFCMGSADIIPGVSGGTMALILGIYERLLKAIRSFDKDWFIDLVHLRISAALSRNDLLFLAPLGFGIIAAILFFTRIVPLPSLIMTHPEMVYGLFFGLIVASIVVLMGEVERYGPRELLTTAAGIALGYTIVTLVPVETPTAAWFIFLCGFIAISAMLLPGISGSFILLILGKYAYIINALGTFELAVIVTFASGALAGLFVFSRSIVWLLERYHQATLLVIKGILIGSLWIIWPFQDRVYETVRGKEKLVAATPLWPDTLDATVIASVLLMLSGFVLVMVIDRLAGKTPLFQGH